MKKKIFSLLLGMTIVVTMAIGVCVPSVAASSGIYSYRISGEEIIITGADSSIEGNIVIPDVIDGYSVTKIEESAFSKCDKVTSITIPASVKRIDVSGYDSVYDEPAFVGCDSLEAIYVAEGNEYFSSVDGVLFNKALTTLVCYPKGRAESSYTIPDTVTAIGSWSFLGCKYLNFVDIPDSVEKIGQDAFSSCTGLKSIAIPDGVTDIYGTFDGCSSLQSVIIPVSVKTVVSDMGTGFSGCTSLKDVYYTGSDVEWKTINFVTGYPFSDNVTIHYGQQHTHIYNKIVTAPTLTEQGYTTYTCDGCGYSYKSDFVDATGKKVSGVTAAQVDDLMIAQVSWDAFEGAEKYIAYIYDSEGNRIKTAQTAKTSIKFSYFEVGSYTAIVIAKVDGKWFYTICADEVSFEIKSSAPIVTAQQINKNDMTVSWNTVDGAVKYYVKVEGKDYIRIYATNSTSMFIKGLVPGTKYNISVNAKLSTGKYIGYGEPSVIETAPYLDMQLTAKLSGDKVILSWNEYCTGKVWIKAVNGDVATQIKVTSGTNITTVPSGADGYYIIARAYVDGATRYITSKTVSI